MKKMLFLMAGTVLFAFSCSKQTPEEAMVPNNNTDEVITGRHCASYDVLQRQLKEDPTLGDRMNSIETFTNRVIQNPSQFRLVNGVIVIPVVVNVLYNTAAQNVSLSQIQSQINVLNADYAGTNTDVALTPSIFQTVLAGNTKIQFVLDTVIRKSTTTTGWSTNDGMKKSPKGITPSSPSTKLNMWVCNLSGGILGYAQFPGGSLSTDGVVIDDNAFGNTGTVTAPYDKGRTATHEVGHWLNLRHIWGDATCGSDLVGDTPQHNAANYGCPASGHRSTCTGTPVEMTMNYMDYTDDACMYMFTAGQNARMQAVFAVGGPRNSFAQP